MPGCRCGRWRGGPVSPPRPPTATTRTARRSSPRSPRRAIANSPGISPRRIPHPRRPTPDDLAAVAVAYVRFALDHPALFRVMFVEPCDPSGDERGDATAAISAYVCDLVRRAFPGVDPEALSTAVWALVHGLAFLAPRRQTRHLHPRRGRRPGPHRRPRAAHRRRGDVARPARGVAGAGDIGAGAFVEAHAGEHDGVQGVVGGPVAAAVEAVAVGASGRGRDRRDPGQVRERGFRTHPFRVVPGRGQQLAGGLGADAEQLQQLGCGLLDQRADLGVQLGDLLVERLVAAGQSTQRRSRRGQGPGQVVAGPQPGEGAYQGCPLQQPSPVHAVSRGPRRGGRGSGSSPECGP